MNWPNSTYSLTSLKIINLFDYEDIQQDDAIQNIVTRLFHDINNQMPSRVLDPESDIEITDINGERHDEFCNEPVEISNVFSRPTLIVDRFRETLRNLRQRTGNPNEVYYYHSDHLGSASWITDNTGIPIQHLQYLPFGEPFVSQRISGYNERFTFTGKERDEETGYGYFGARYMDHELMTMWLSVDPMADKYPGISPYAYCAWNPIKLVDPDGRDWYDIDKYGNIKRNDEKSKDYKDQDVIHSTYTGNTLGGFIKGTIEKVTNSEKQEYEFTEDEKIKTGSATGTQIDINASAEDAKSIYDFCILNTDHIEFSLIQSDRAGTEWYISTSHSHVDDEFSTALGYVLASAGSFYSHRHNHPYLGVGCKKPSEGDKTFMRRTTAMMKHFDKPTPTYGLSIVVKGKVENLNYNEDEEYFN